MSQNFLRLKPLHKMSSRSFRDETLTGAVERTTGQNAKAREIGIMSPDFHRAIQMFESVLNLIPDIPDYKDVITKLEEAQTLYRQVGDDAMAAKAREYVVAFQHLQEGKIALMNGNHNLAQNSLSRALGHFSKLDEQAIIHHVKRLLELSRHVVS